MAFQVGTMPDEMAIRSMKLFADKVMPVVRREIDQYLDKLYPNRNQSDIAAACSLPQQLTDSIGKVPAQ